MITLNLISPQKKKEIRLNEFYILIKNLIILLLLFTILVAMILLATKLTLQNTFNKTVADSTLTTIYGNIFNSDIKEFNQRLKSVEKIQKQYIPWTSFILSFASLTPKNVGISSLSLSQDKEEKNKVLIVGSAKTRDDLLEFKNNLENSQIFINVSVPLENLLKKDDVNFDIKAELALDKLDQ